MQGRATHQQAGRKRRAIVIALLLIGGFLLQAAIGYYLLYRSHNGEKPTTHAHFSQLIETLDSIDGSPYNYYSQRGDASRAFWSASAQVTPGVVRAEGRWGRQTQRDYWGNYVYYYQSPNNIDRFRRLVPRSCDRMFIKRDAAGELFPNTPVDTEVVYVACGWPMVSLAGIDRNTPTAAGDSWHTAGAHVIEVQRQTFTGRRTDRIILPMRPLLVGTLVNTMVFGAMLGVLLLLVTCGRRLWRYERGRCPRCTYDLRSAFDRGCPECGWRRPDPAAEQPADH